MALSAEVLKSSGKALGVPAAAGVLAGPVGLVAAGGVAAGYETFKGIITIKEGEIGVRFRFGKVARHKRDNPRKGHIKGEAKQVQPGVHASFPGTHPIRRVSIQDRPHDLETMQVMRPEGQYDVRASVTWGITEKDSGGAKSLVVVDNLNAVVANNCERALRTAAQIVGKEHLDSVHLGDTLFEMMLAGCSDQLFTYGAELRHFQLKEFSPSIGEMILRAGKVQMGALLGAQLVPTVHGSEVSAPTSMD